MRIHPISDSARLIRTARLHARVEQKVLAESIGKRKSWLSKRESGIVHLKLSEAMELLTTLMEIVKARSKNEVKTAVLQESVGSRAG